MSGRADENVGGVHRRSRTRPPDTKRSSSTAFVLSGGASLGAVQVGMLLALYEASVRPDVIVGTSVGAINGAFIAARPPTLETASQLASMWRRTRRSRVFPVSPLRGLSGFLGSSNHLVPDSGLRRLVEACVGRAHLEDLPIPLHVVAVDVITGEEVVLSAGPAVDAVMASAAIPGVLPPVQWRDRQLIDGSVADNTPISQAITLGAREIYVLPTGHACALTAPPGSALGMSLHALSLLMHGRLVADITHYRNRAKIVVLPPPCPLTVSPVDFGQADRLIAQALADARMFLAGGGAERPPIHMRVHQHIDLPAGPPIHAARSETDHACG